MVTKAKYLRLVLLVSVLFLIGACDNTEEERLKTEWVENEVNSLIEQYKVQKMKECMEEIIKEAEYVVDSLLSDKDLFNDIITDRLPMKPTKPEFVPLDSIALQNHKVEPVVTKNLE